MARYLRLAEVAVLLQVAPVTVPRMVKRGELPPPTSIGTRIRVWNGEELEAFLAARRAGPALPGGRPE
jgi:excisionase family DNA binding protein